MRAPHRLRRLAFACLAVTALHAGAARAQAVDYGTLEQVFGEPITLSATGKPQRASDVPADMVIITQDDIRRSGATTIPDILQFVTGIDIRRYSFADTPIGIRGYDTPINPRLLVLVDGRQVYSEFFGFEAWNAMPVQLGEIRQIEVVKGPNSALFGFNAVGGVVNIVTFDPLSDNTKVATIRGGTQGYGEGEVVATQRFGAQASVRVSAGGWTATGYPQPVAVSIPSPRYASFNIDGRWQVTPWIRLQASGGYTDSHTGTRLPVGAIEDFRDHISYARVGAAAQTGVGTFNLDIYRNQELYNTFAPEENTTFVAKIDDLVKLDAANTLRAGFEYRRNDVNSVPLYGGTVSYDNYALNSMWDWQISPVFDLTNAVRLDHLVLHQAGILLPIPQRISQAFNTATITQPSFNSGLVMHLTDLDTVRVLASRGLLVPSLADFGLQLGVAPNVYALGTPTTQPESVWDAELAYNRALPVLGVTLETAIFFQRHTGLLASPGAARPRQEGQIIVSTVEDFGSSNEVGFELGVRGTTAGGLRWNASYRYASITQDTTSMIFPSQATDFKNGTPVHDIIVGAGYSTGPWEFDVAGRFQSKFTDYAPSGGPASPLPVTIPAYVTFNARIGCRITDSLILGATAEQFNVSRLLESSAQYIDRRFIASATLRY